MPELHDLRGDHVIVVPIPIQGTAGSLVAGPAVAVPFDCTVQSVKHVPSAAVTANATNFAVNTLTNGGATGAGTAAIGARSYVATNSVALTAEAVTSLTNTALVAGDLLYNARTVGASGVATGAGSWIVTVRAT